MDFYDLSKLAINASVENPFIKVFNKRFLLITYGSLNKLDSCTIINCRVPICWPPKLFKMLLLKAISALWRDSQS